ncbi:hypothetical protein BD289DRAFT_452147 [Coniella lustricola]|uniref:Uncharacterized protein n=1 Tax=Coniella lustricola TaxID=2025994 RepID=A0A2T3AC18_9PEZI|nr:hypothetical protein BD289DRAFT_452147 [Coniella lustricola]
MVANFRSYEGQIRLLTSVIAAHPELKLNYKEIHKYFGDSTPDGIQFQFRAIKKDAENMRKGIDPSGKGSAGESTPVTPKSAVPKTPRTAGSRKRSAPSGGKSTVSKKLKDSTAKTTQDISTIVDDDSEGEFPPLAMTPTKKRGSSDKPTQMTREHTTVNLDTNETPSLQSAQITTPDDEDELRILTPADAGAAFSFSQSAPNVSASFNTHTTPWSHGNAYFTVSTQESYIADGYEDEC